MLIHYKHCHKIRVYYFILNKTVHAELLGAFVCKSSKSEEACVSRCSPVRVASVECMWCECRVGEFSLMLTNSLDSHTGHTQSVTVDVIATH